MATIASTQGTITLAEPSRARALQGWGGAAAIAFAALLLVNVGVILIYFPTQGFSADDYANPQKALAFIQGHAPINIAFPVLGLVLSAGLLATVAALRKRLGTTSELAVMAAVMGVIGATAAILYWSVNAAVVFVALGNPATFLQDQPVGDALHDVLIGPFADFAMAAFAFLTGTAALRGGGLPRWLAIASMLAAVGMFLDLVGVPLFQFVAALWLLAVAYVLIRRPVPV